MVSIDGRCAMPSAETTRNLSTLSCLWQAPGFAVSEDSVLLEKGADESAVFSGRIPEAFSACRPGAGITITNNSRAYVTAAQPCGQGFRQGQCAVSARNRFRPSDIVKVSPSITVITLTCGRRRALPFQKIAFCSKRVPTKVRFFPEEFLKHSGRVGQGAIRVVVPVNAAPVMNVVVLRVWIGISVYTN